MKKGFRGRIVIPKGISASDGRRLASLPAVRKVIQMALREDIGWGDITSQALVPRHAVARAVIEARGSYVICGLHVAAAVFRLCDSRLNVALLTSDGKKVHAGQKVLRVFGSARSILAAERTALNFLQRLSGIATKTAAYIKKVKRYDVAILDTRKTTPCLRQLEKYAVSCGGGCNHRMGLYDMVLIKDNHRVFWKKSSGKSLSEAVRVARKRSKGAIVEIEVENEQQLEDALAGRPDWVLLDNMTPSQMRKCIRIVARRCLVEASGGITLQNLTKVAVSGVDAISIGSLTHSPCAADFSLEFV